MQSSLEWFQEILQKNAIHEIVKTGKDVAGVISEMGLGNISDESELIEIVNKIIKTEVDAVNQAKANPQAINYLVGKVMKETRGKADPKITLELLKKAIEI